MVLDQGCTTFNSIIVTHILNYPDLFYLGVVHVPASDALNIVAFSFTHHGSLEITDKLSTFFTLTFKQKDKDQ